MTVSPASLVAALGAVVKAAAKLKGVPAPVGLDAIEPCADSLAIAQSLVGGKSKAVFLGNVAEQVADATQLQALAGELGRLTGASVGFIGEAANSVGGYVAQALPSALNAYEMFAQPRQAYVLMGVEPELDCYNPQLAIAALKQAALVVMLTPFKHEAALDYADVLLPVSPYTETSGTFVNTEGRVQSFSGVCRPLAETRPGWKVLRVLGNLLGLDGFAYESSEQVRDEVLPTGTDFVTGLDNGLGALPIVLNTAANELQRIADVPIHFADQLVRNAVALQLTLDAAAPQARMNAETLGRIGIGAGDSVKVRQGQGDAYLTAVFDDKVPSGCVRVAAAHASTAALGDMFGTITVERA